MPLLAGQIMTAGQAGRLQPRTYEAVGTSNLALTTTEADVPGASITLDAETAGAVYVAHAVFSFDATGTTTAFAAGALDLDGAGVTGNARWTGDLASDFGSPAMLWRGTLTAGTHTFKLRGSISSGTGIQVLGAFTKLIVTVHEVV